MTTMTATELAIELDTTGREVRKFLRSITPKDEQPGKGSRWGIARKDLRSLKSKYNKWVAANEAKAAAKVEAEVEAEVEVEAEGPTPEELAAIDAEG